QWRPVRLADHIQERIRSDAAIARVRDGRTDQPHRPSVLAARIFLPLRGAWRIGRILTREAGNRVRVLRRTFKEVQLVSGFDYGRSVQTYAVFLAKSGQHLVTLDGLARTKPSVGVPEIGYDPHAQNVVAEIAERRASVNGAPVGGKSPILSEPGSRDTCYVKTVILQGRVAHAPAGRGLEGAIRQNLFERGVSLKVAHYIFHLDTAGVRHVGEVVNARHESDDTDELGRGTRPIVYVAAGGRQDADVCAVGIGVRVVHHPIQLPGQESRRSLLPEDSEARGGSLIQLAHADTVCVVEVIVEIKRWRVKMNETRLGL